jgi:uncharacterized protein YaiI (UPF0178 family)
MPMPARCARRFTAWPSAWGWRSSSSPTARGRSGRLWTENNIGNALAGREVGRYLRETGVNTGGPPPFSKADRSRFLNALDGVVQAALREQRPT